MDAVRQHLKANAVAVPNDLEKVIMDQMCQKLPPGHCVDEQGRIPATGNRADCATFQVVLQGTRTLADWKRDGGKLEDNEEITRRSLICSRCPKNDLIPGCMACNSEALRTLVDTIVGTTRLPSDVHLRQCVVCCCSLVPKVRLPLDVLQRNLSGQQKAQLPDACWLK